MSETTSTPHQSCGPYPLAQLAAIRSLDGGSFGLVIEALDTLQHESQSPAIRAQAEFEKVRLWKLYEEAKENETENSATIMEAATTGAERREKERRGFIRRTTFDRRES